MGLHSRFDYAGWIAERLMEDTKPYDGLMHPSTDLVGCEIAMCHRHDPDIEMLPNSVASMQRMRTGTLWHEWLQKCWEDSDWEGYMPECEVDVTPGLPKGWAGTADLLLGHVGDNILQEAEFTLFDAKTVLGSSLTYLDMNAPKKEHLYQVSAYWHAADAMGYKMQKEACIVHIPISPAPYKEIVPPILQWFTPLPRNVACGEMKRRSRVLKNYLAQKAGEDCDSELLPKPLEMVPYSKPNKRVGKMEHGVKPGWQVRFCNSPICACAGQVAEVLSYDDSYQEAGSL